MVKINKRLRTGNSPVYTLLIAAAVIITGVTLFNGGDADYTALSTLSPSATSEQFALNARALKAWRADLRDKCAKAKSEAEVQAIASINKQGFTMPSAKVEQPRDDRAVVPCKSVVLDFGANIGDTSGHVIDSGMVACERTDLGAGARTPDVHFDIETKQFTDIKRRNPLTRHLVKLMEASGKTTGPEDYCYYGVEGNPVFTERLQGIEDYVMAISPRPIQHMHFFTESVGAGEDGPTKLYLDTINTKENFWGSSIFKDHQDVRKSAQEGNTTAETIAADVMGYTIGTLMRKTLVAFSPSATEADKSGNHLVLKVDIEGGEYPLLHQAVEEGTLCEFVKMGNQADLFIEFHSQKVTGRHDFVGKTKEMKEKLTSCGVTFRNLAAWWS